MEQRAPGKGLLKVTGILLIIGGVFCILQSVYSSALVSMLSLPKEELAPNTAAIFQEMGLTVQKAQLSAATSSIQGILYLVAGIFGVRNCNKIEKSQICFACGIFLIIFVLFNTVIAGVISKVWSSALLSGIAALTFPVLYCMGALKNRQAMQGK